ncbi:MAG: hypothetical protein ACAH80_13580 [Alphaproteobacteria bacterium]
MLLYEKEFEKLKDIYAHLRPASKEMVRPILAMPLVVVALFGIVLVPFGVLSVAQVLLLGIAACGVAAGLIYGIVDVKKELSLYRDRMQALQKQPSAQKRSIAMAAANDPGAQAAAQQKQAQTK